jgi:hypothetical protein
MHKTKSLAMAAGILVSTGMVMAATAKANRPVVCLLSESQMRHLVRAAAPEKPPCDSGKVTQQCIDLYNCQQYSNDPQKCNDPLNACKKCSGNTSTYCTGSKPWNVIGCTSYTTRLNGCGKLYLDTTCNMVLGSCVCDGQNLTLTDCAGSTANYSTDDCNPVNP